MLFRTMIFRSRYTFMIFIDFNMSVFALSPKEKVGQLSEVLLWWGLSYHRHVSRQGCGTDTRRLLTSQ